MAHLDLVEESICESQAKNRTQIGHVSWILMNEIFERLWESMREVVLTTYGSSCTISGVKFVKFHQKKEKSTKNDRFGSGFLHVIHKLIPQQDSICNIVTYVAKTPFLCRFD